MLNRLAFAKVDCRDPGRLLCVTHVLDEYTVLIFPAAPIRMAALSASSPRLITGPRGWRLHHAVPAVPG